MAEALSLDLPDLLHSVPMARTNLSTLRERLRFAFAAAGSDVALCESFDEGRIAPSTFEPKYFESDLYLEVFLRAHAAFNIRGRGYQARLAPLLRVLSHPPSEAAHRQFRQAILRELGEQPGYKEQLEQAYAAGARLRDLLSESGLGARLDANRRRVDVLEAARHFIDALARGFEGASSGLLRLRVFGQRVQGLEGYARLRQFLAFEDGASSIDARLQIGYDGRLRTFEIVRISNHDSPYRTSWWSNVWRKLKLFFKGFRFSDAEVLGAFVDEVFTGIEDELVKVFQLLCDMEFYLVALAFRERALSRGLAVCLPDFASADAAQAAERKLLGLFNPLLLAGEGNIVPCDIQQERHDAIVLLTGPNSGGKTRLLQALSLSQILGQGGYFVPAAEAKLVPTSAMFLSIGEQSSALQKEGRLGSELVRIRNVFESLLPGAFVAVDELCSGTNPSEGEEIFRMVLELLRELGPQVFISTHFLEFAASLARDPGQSNLCFLRVELDANEQPTYRFVPGVATTSLAKQTAARLGVTAGELRALIETRKARAAAQGEPVS